jgi:hypothetical protein
MGEHFPDVRYESDPAVALDGAVAALVMTNWEAITELDDEFDTMATPVVVGGRRTIDRRDGLVYEGLTWWCGCDGSVPMTTRSYGGEKIRR